MDYLLTENGLMIPIMMPLVFEMMVIIEIERCMFHRMKWIIVSAWYLFGIIIECFLCLYHFHFYLCYIWILGVIAGYPILYFFSKLGDLVNRDLTLEEQKIYYKISYVQVGIIGICILLFVHFEKFNQFVYKNLDSKTIFFSKCLYLLLGLSCVLSSVALKRYVKQK